jgi:hypothetical protein
METLIGSRLGEFMKGEIKRLVRPMRWLKIINRMMRCPNTENISLGQDLGYLRRISWREKLLMKFVINQVKDIIFESELSSMEIFLGDLIILFIIFSHLIGQTSLLISPLINSPSLDPISVSINSAL